MPRAQSQRHLRVASSPTPEPSRRTTSINVIRNILVKLEKAIDRLPILRLKAAAGRIIKIIEITVNAKQGTNHLKDLYIQLCRLENTIITPLLNQPPLESSPVLQTRLDRVASELDQLARDWQRLNITRNPIVSLTDHDYGVAASDISRRIKESIDIFQLESQMYAPLEITYGGLEQRDKHSVSKEVQTLPYAAASFDLISQNNALVCFPGTRVAVIEDIIDWIVHGGHRTYILNGIAGVGKTTIAQTIATLAAKFCFLSASFFFSKDETDRTSSRIFFPNLAFQLARFSEQFEDQISKALMKWPDAPSRTPQEQLRRLIIEPLQGLSVLDGRPILIVLDALDECTPVEGGELLRLLVGAMSQLPTNFKLFITMRPEPQFSQILNTDLGGKQLILHDIEEMAVQEDIRRYLHHQLSQAEVEGAIHGCNWQIGADDLEALVRAAGRLFIVASTAEKFIKDPIQRDPQHQLNTLLGGDNLDEYDLSPHATLDNMYMQILEAAVPASRSSAHIVNRFQNVIGSVIVLQYPLPLTSLAKLLEIGLPACEAALHPLHSVIVLNNHDGSPRVYHPSFPNFITDSNRCRDRRFLIDSPEHHARLTVLCLDMMDRLLRGNMCDLPIPDRYMKNAEIPDLATRIQEYIPTELEYACTYWAVHLSKSAFSEEVMMKLETFTLKHLLSWLEVLSLVGQFELAYPALAYARNFVTSNHPAVELLALLNDAQRFLVRSYEIIKMSAMHIYYSALPMAPVDSDLFRMYEHQADESIDVLWGRENPWNAALAVLVGHSGEVNSVVFSPDGSCFASASNDETVRLWDGMTGAVVAELRGHSHWVNSVVFSPDGSRLASASSDMTVRLWDGVTGAVVGELQGHSGWVHSVVFSPDGSRLASASDDKTVRLWDGVTGAVVVVLRGHSGSVNSMVFSPDGSRLASAARDDTARLWDGVTGAIVAELRGHSHSVKSVVFSPNGSLLASGSSDKTVLLWDGVTGGVVAELRGHSSSVNSVVFSPDGSRLASASSDYTVRLWDGVMGAEVAELRGHSGGVNSVVFSPDASLLASASSDKTVRLWDGVTGAVVAELRGHSSWVNSVVFSPDGSRLASASSDMMVRLWDRLAGDVVGELQGRSDWVHSVVFSPDRSRLASASGDKTARLWDGVTGAVVAELRGHSGSVNSVVFSPNGSRLASAARGNTVRLWDGVTGAIVAELRGHSYLVNSVVFSTDGSLLASGSSDKTARLWDGVTGGVVAELRGHSGGVNSVVFSPDTALLASASSDRMVRLWDVVTGGVVAELRGHSDWVYSVVFSPDGSRLASASSDTTVRLWDGVTGTEVAELRGHLGSVESVVFSPDGSRLASQSLHTVRLWDGVTGAFVAQYKSRSVPYVFQIDTRIDLLTKPPTFEDRSTISGRNVDKSTTLLASGQQIDSFLLEFNRDAGSHVLLGLWEKPDETLSEVCLCWLPPGLGRGTVAQSGTRIALGLSDGRIFIFSTSRLKRS